MRARVSNELVARFRDYVVEEPSYTVKFAAWELGLSVTAVALANAEMLKLGIAHQIEPRSGPLAAVYAYRPIPGDTHSPRRRVESANNTTHRAVTPVPGTGKPMGPTGKPSRKPTARRVKKRKSTGRKL